MKCPRCGYETENVQLFRKHLTRKTICNSENAHIPIDYLKEKYLPKRYDYGCECCERKFTSAHGLSKHMNICKNKDITDKDIIKKLQVEVAELRQLINHCASSSGNVNQTTNNVNQIIQTTNNITQNNIVIINPLGTEDVSHITPEFMLDCIRKKVDGVAQYIHKKHFDPEHPENHNIKVANDHYEILDLPMLCSSKNVIDLKPHGNNVWAKIRKRACIEEHILTRVELAFRNFLKNYPVEKIPTVFIEEFIAEIVLPLDWTMDLDIEDDIDIDEQENVKQIIIETIRKHIDEKCLV